MKAEGSAAARPQPEAGRGRQHPQHVAPGLKLVAWQHFRVARGWSGVLHPLDTRSTSHAHAGRVRSSARSVGAALGAEHRPGPAAVAIALDGFRCRATGRSPLRGVGVVRPPLRPGLRAAELHRKGVVGIPCVREPATARNSHLRHAEKAEIPGWGSGRGFPVACVDDKHERNKLVILSRATHRGSAAGSSSAPDGHRARKRASRAGGACVKAGPEHQRLQRPAQSAPHGL